MDIKSLCANVEVSFCQFRRSANKVADFIVRHVNKFGWISGDFSRAAMFDQVFDLCKSNWSL